MSYRGTPRLWYTFGPVSTAFDAKSVVKIYYDVPVTPATKLKNCKVRTGLIQTFLNKIVDSR